MSRRIRAALLLLLAVSVAPPTAHGAITPANVGSLAVRWDAPIGGVTGALLFANGLLYVTGWDARLHALDPDTGVERWQFQAGSIMPGGAIAVPGGNVCFGDYAANVFCVRGADGSLVWQKSVLKKPQDAVWANLAAANGRLFVGVASKGDNPCTQGRLVALDLATGADLWELETVPDRVCRNDTAVTCTNASECGGSACVEGLGAGVTGTVIFDPTGNFVYMNTVGCLTSPSIGDSEAIFKLEAGTGDVVWKTRVTPREQFGSCDNDHSVDCGTDADCVAVGGTCHQTCREDPANPGTQICEIRKPGIYHDFGFLNAPLRIDVPAGGATKTLIVSGSKHGSLYALNEADGTIAWRKEIQPIPVTPFSAGYGLFNGAIAYADGRVHAALNSVIPERVCDQNHVQRCRSDAECATGICLPAPPHLMAFDPAADGAILWSDEIGASWSSVAVVNGVVYAGTNVTDESTGESNLFAYDTATGTRLATFHLPSTSVARSLVVGDTLFVGYGYPLSQGTGSGVRALSLCGNTTIDPGEECDPGAADTHGCCTTGCRLVTGACDDTDVCTTGDACVSGHCTATLTPGAACTVDDGNVCTDPVCDQAGACVQQFNTSPCDDGDGCTSSDRCASGVCAGSLGSTDAVGCVVDRIVDRPCGDTPLPRPLAAAVQRKLAAVHRLLDRAAKLAARGQTAKVEKLRTSAGARVASIKDLTAKAVATRSARRRISAECKAAVDTLVERGRLVVSGFTF